MAEAEFVFSYKLGDGSNNTSAYDASQALYGISRSLSIFTHYALHRRVIKQATSLTDAVVLVEPPRPGSFEFIIRIFETATDPSTRGGVVLLGLATSTLYDLTKTVYKRLSGIPGRPSSEEIRELQVSASGDLDALTDSVEEDILRIQRPIINNNVTVINIYGGENSIIDLDSSTFEFAKTKIVGNQEEEFIGNVTSLNGTSIQGRFWVDEEERSVGFSIEKTLGKLPGKQRMLLAASLNDWVSRLEGQIVLRGYPLRSKTGLLKRVFITEVRRIKN